MSNPRLRRRATPRLHLVFGGATLLSAFLLLAGCSTVIDKIPTGMGGLPASAPARPAESVEYLPIGAMPPARDTPPLTAEEQKKLGDELVAVRDKQAASVAAAAAANGAPPPVAAPAPATPKAAPPKKDAKKPPAEKKPTQASSN
jgi:hypothetical protein